jgi:hypothetical protein
MWGILPERALGPEPAARAYHRWVHDHHVAVPAVRLGALRENGIAAGLLALVERGVERRPALAVGARGTVELRFAEGFEPVRVEFAEDSVLVEDGGGAPPDVVVSGTLPDVLHLITVRQVGGVPHPLDRRGRRALRHLASGRVAIVGSRALGRRFLQLIQIGD